MGATRRRRWVNDDTDGVKRVCVCVCVCVASPRDGIAFVVEPVVFAIAERAFEDANQSRGGFARVDQAAAFGHARAHPTRME